MWTDYYSSLYSSEIQSRSVYSNALPGFWTHRQCSRQAEYRGLTTGVLSCSVVSDSMEWVPISYSKGSSRPKDRTHVSCISCVGCGVFSLHHLGRPYSSEFLLPIWEINLHLLTYYSLPDHPSIIYPSIQKCICTYLFTLNSWKMKFF